MAVAARWWLWTASASWSRRDMPLFLAMFSAVTPMWQSSKGSVSAPTIASTTAPSFIRWPQRSPGPQFSRRLVLQAAPIFANGRAYAAQYDHFTLCTHHLSSYYDWVGASAVTLARPEYCLAACPSLPPDVDKAGAASNFTTLQRRV